MQTINMIDLANVHGGQTAKQIDEFRANFNRRQRTRSLSDLGFSSVEQVEAMPRKYQLQACDDYFPGSREDLGRTDEPNERNKMIDVCKSNGFGF